MVTKNQIDKLLEKDLTPKEVVRLLIEDAEEAVRSKSATSSLEEELTFGEAETQKLYQSQSQKDQWKTGQWLQAYETIGYNELQAKVEGLEAIESLKTVTAKIKEISLVRDITLSERSKPVIMTQKEYEEKKQALWEVESQEQIPVLEAVQAKAEKLFFEEEGDYPGKDEEIPEEIYERAQEWVKELVTERGLEPKEADEPLADTGYKFEGAKELDIDNWPFRYFTQGELAEVEDSPFSYIKDFDPDRYEEEVTEEDPQGHLPPEVAIIQNPSDHLVDERGWYDPVSKAQSQMARETLEEYALSHVGDPDQPDSLQEFWDIIIERGIKNKIARFKAHQLLNRRFYRSLGMELESSKDAIEKTESRLKTYLKQYEGFRAELKWMGDEAVWTLSAGEEVEFQPIDYDSIEPSQARIQEWGSQLGVYLGDNWLEKEPEDVVISE